MRKFNKSQFMTTFLELASERFRTWRYPPVILCLSDLAREACRKNHYAQWANRQAMIDALKEWWKSLPQRNDGRYGKNIFGKNCHLSSSWGPTFIWLAESSGCKSFDLVSFW